VAHLQVERGAQLGHRLRPLLGPHAQARIDGLQQARAVALAQDVVARERHITVGQQPRHRRRRRAAAHGHVHHGRQRIHVGPRALRHVGHFGVLLDGRIAGLEDDSDRLRLVGDHAARGAEIEHHRPARAFEQDDVVGRDVAVVAVGVVHHRQRLRDAVHDAEQPGFVHACGDGHQRFPQRVASVEGHDHVGGAALLPEAVDLEQRRVVELGEQAGFVDEAAHAEVEGFPVSFGQGDDGAVVLSCRQRRREVLLDGDDAFERRGPRLRRRRRSRLGR
jgi:hypothetical protein